MKIPKHSLLQISSTHSSLAPSLKNFLRGPCNGKFSQISLYCVVEILYPRCFQLRLKILINCHIVSLFSVFTSHVIKTKQLTVQWIESRIWNKIDDWYINNIAKNQVFAAFHSRVICKSMSPRFRELCMETPCLCPSEGHKYGGRKVTETSATEYCYRNETLMV